jgi:hypothetical protein
MARNPIFGVPAGNVTVEVPDGVTKTMGDCEVRNSLMNSYFAHGGPDARGFGAFDVHHDRKMGGGIGSRNDGTSRFRTR